MTSGSRVIVFLVKCRILGDVSKKVLTSAKIMTSMKKLWVHRNTLMLLYNRGKFQLPSISITCFSLGGKNHKYIKKITKISKISKKITKITKISKKITKISKISKKILRFFEISKISYTFFEVVCPSIEPILETRNKMESNG